MNLKIPEGYELDLEKSTQNNIVLKKKHGLPEKWEDLRVIKGYYIDTDSCINDARTAPHSHAKNVWPTHEEAIAALALSQLCQLRDVYNKNEELNWDDLSKTKHAIVVNNKGEIIKSACFWSKRVLIFKTAELRDEFFNNFKLLIEQAKPLL